MVVGNREYNHNDNLSAYRVALAALVLASSSFGGLVSTIGFGMLAVVWIISTAFAYIHIRNGNIGKHQAWMLGSYALTLAAVTLRIYLPLSLNLGIPFESAYPAIAWFCWVPNIIILEWFLMRSVTTEPFTT